MREQASQIDVAPFADPSQVPTPAGRRLTRREAEPTGKLPAAPKRVNVPDARDERRRRQHADPGDLLQAPRDGMLASNCGEFVIDRGDARVEPTDFVEQQPDGMAHEPGQVHLRILEQRRNALQRGARSRTKRQTKLAQDATHHVDPSRPRRLPLRSNAMQGLNRLLFRGLHWHGLDLAASIRLEEGFRISAIRFIAADIGRTYCTGSSRTDTSRARQRRPQ